MKTSTKFIIATLIILPFLSWAGFFWYSNTLEQLQLNGKSLHGDSIEFAESSNDIGDLRKILLMKINSQQEMENDYIEVNYSFVSMLLVFAICNIVFLFLVYWDIRKMVSNKALHEEREKDTRPVS